MRQQEQGGRVLRQVRACSPLPLPLSLPLPQPHPHPPSFQSLTNRVGSNRSALHRCPACHLVPSRLSVPGKVGLVRAQWSVAQLQLLWAQL